MKRGKRIDLTQEQLVLILQNWIQRHQKLPTTVEWSEDKSHPSCQTYTRRFGMTWQRILASINAADLLKDHFYLIKNHTDEEILSNFYAEVHRLAGMISGLVTRKAYDQLRSSKSMTSQGMMKHLNRSWDELLESAGLPAERIRHRRTLSRNR